MTMLSEETDVFASADSDSCVVMFIARQRQGTRSHHRRLRTESTLAAVDGLGHRGWALSVRQMFTGSADGAWVYATGFAHDAEIVGVFEAPSMGAALAGTVSLEDAGWAELFTTEWLIGPREFAPAPSQREIDTDRSWGFLALWKWNDAWQQATHAERREYDAECDIAFAADLNAGINIAGRHRLDWATGWHHLGVWESPSFIAVDAAMREHERVADFKFTTSRHYIGRRTRLADVLGVTNA